MSHAATLRKGIVGPGGPGHRVFESNYVIECPCGFHLGCASSETSARQRLNEHERTGR